jgi:arylsulfatase A-like enzyme
LRLCKLFILIFFLLFNIWAEERPNIIIILVDDAGATDFSCYGSKQILTPHIDSLAQNGIKFTDAYTASSVCSPSRAGLLTGRYQQKFGHLANIPHEKIAVNDPATLGLPTSETTLATALKDEGYRTHCIGKWHLGEAEKFQPNSRGFDNFYGFLSGARTYYLGGELRGDMDRIRRNNQFAEPASGYTTEIFTQEAIRIIKEESEKPFFIYLSHNAVHGPMDVKEEDIMSYNFKNPKRKKYSGLMKNLDDQTGLLMQSLKDADKHENTLVFFMSDNGGPTSHNGSSNWPLRSGKGSEFEGGNRTPFIIQWPAKISANTVSSTPVISYDIFTTCINVAKGKLAQDRVYDGVNLLEIINGSKPHDQRPLFWSRGKNYAIRQGKWKLITLPQGSFLYDLSKDISEKNDLSDSFPEVKSELTQLLNKWKSTHAKALWSTGYKEKKKH